MTEHTIYPSRPEGLVSCLSIEPAYSETPVVCKARNCLIKQITENNTHIQIIGHWIYRLICLSVGAIRYWYFSYPANIGQAVAILNYECEHWGTPGEGH